MGLNYDIDILPVIPEEISEDPDLRRLLKVAGFAPHSPASRIGLFRDPATAAALARAPEAVRAFMDHVGVGADPHVSTVPPGRYLTGDEPGRLQITRAAMEAMEQGRFALPREGQADPGGGHFLVSQFMLALTRAEPIDPDMAATIAALVGPDVAVPALSAAGPEFAAPAHGSGVSHWGFLLGVSLVGLACLGWLATI